MRHRNSTHSNVMQVPEISGASKPKLDASVLTALVKRAQASLGKQAAVPMIIGPITMARLATLTDTDVPAVVKKLTPLYTQLLKELSGLGVRASVASAMGAGFLDLRLSSPPVLLRCAQIVHRVYCTSPHSGLTIDKKHCSRLLFITVAQANAVALIHYLDRYQTRSGKFTAYWSMH